jgi:hypothetical protein
MNFCLSWVLSGRGLCDGRMTCPEESYWPWCVVSVISKPQPWGGLGPLRDVEQWQKELLPALIWTDISVSAIFCYIVMMCYLIVCPIPCICHMREFKGLPNRRSNAH